MLLLLSTDGTLLCFHIIYLRPGAPAITVVADRLTTDGERKNLGMCFEIPDSLCNGMNIINDFVIIIITIVITIIVIVVIIINITVIIIVMLDVENIHWRILVLYSYSLTSILLMYWTFLLPLETRTLLPQIPCRALDFLDSRATEPL